MSAPPTETMTVVPLSRPMVARVTDIHVRAFPSFFLTALGAPFLRTYYDSLAGDPDAITVVAVEDGRPVAFAVGAVNPRGYYSRLLRRRWLRFGLAAVPALVRAPGRIRRVLRATSHPGENPEGPGVCGLFSIAVDPATQRGGVGRRVLAAFLDEARRRGGTAVFLTTDRDGNDRTNTFYLSAGFRAERSFVTPEGRRMNEHWIRFDDTQPRP